MNSTLTTHRKRKIFYELSPHIVYSDKKLEKLNQNEVKHIFIITSGKTNANISSEWIDYYRENGCYP